MQAEGPDVITSTVRKTLEDNTTTLTVVETKFRVDDKCKGSTIRAWFDFWTHLPSKVVGQAGVWEPKVQVWNGLGPRP